MSYRDVMNAFSNCNFGAILASENDTILDINEAGVRLLHATDSLLEKSLQDVAPFLLKSSEAFTFGNPEFNQYLLPCPEPEIPDLPPNTRILVFRDATKEFQYDLLKNVFDHLSDAITVWDNECRMLTLNSAAVKLEAHLIKDVMGKRVTSLYQANNGSILVIPQTIKEKKPFLDLRQDFVTHSGKELQILSNNYPIIKDGQLLGAMSIMEDWSKMDELNRKIIELQGKLLGRENQTKSIKGSLLAAKYKFNDIVYSTEDMRSVVEKCKKVAKSDAPIMIYGETGTGKELFTQSIHNASPRAKGPFLAVNCAAIPDTLLESMLFGTEKGAYTGAEKLEGLFEQANKGTLLLDEINSMNISLQSKLLRVLQEGSFRRVGGSQLIHVDVRVLSNINIPPLEAIRENKLRQDLYYRLGVININVPPLRNRKEDIRLLVKNFIMDCNCRLRKNVSDIDAVTCELFFCYEWPGNVRELQHAVEYAMNILPDEIDYITPEYIPEHILEKVHPNMDMICNGDNVITMESVMEAAGRHFLKNLLMKNNCNVSQTARAIGITRQGLQHRMRKLGISINNLTTQEK